MTHSNWPGVPDLYVDRDEAVDAMFDTLRTRGYTVQTETAISAVDFLAHGDGATCVGGILDRHSTPGDCLTLAEAGATADGLLLFGPDEYVLASTTDLLRQPYVRPTSAGVALFTYEQPLQRENTTTPVVPLTASTTWTLTHEGRLRLTVDGTVVATGDAGDPVTTYHYDTHHVYGRDDELVVIDADGTIVDRATTIDAINTAWNPISPPVVPRTGEYRSLLDTYQPWYCDEAGPIEFDTTAWWVHELNDHDPGPTLLEYGLMTFIESHLVTADDALAPDEFLPVFQTWFTAETGLSAPDHDTIVQHLPAVTHDDTDPGDHPAVLPGYTWRVPREIHSPDHPIDPAGLDR